MIPKNSQNLFKNKKLSITDTSKIYTLIMADTSKLYTLDEQNLNRIYRITNCVM